MMNQRRIIDLIEEKISGEWGTDSISGNGVKVLRTTNFTNEGRLRFDSVVEREIDSKIVEKKKLKFGDTIIEKSGGSPSQPVGRVVLFNLKNVEPFLCNNFTAILRPKKDVYPQYFFWSLYSKHLNNVTLKYQNKTTGILNLKLERYLEEEKINVPDLKTQQKIAHILEQADLARQKRKQANQLTEAFLQSVFLEMFGDPVRNEKKWKKDLLRNVCSFSQGIQVPIEHQKLIHENGYNRFLRISDYTTNCEERFVDNSDERYFVKDDDLVMVRYGASAGFVGIGKEGILANNLFKLNHNRKLLNYVFLFHLLQTDYFKTFIQKVAFGAAMPALSFAVLSDFAIPLPPLSIQKKFATLVEQIEQLRTKQKESEKELENLFNSLMRKYFG